MTLIGLAISVALAYSLAVDLGLGGKPFWWELATLVDIMLAGHWIEMRSVQASSRALEHLAALVPPVAHRKRDDGSLEDVDVAALAVGDLVLVRPGEPFPADGEVVEGTTSANESFLTGESRPVTKQPGDEVLAGAINGEGAVTVRITRIGEATAVSQMMRLVEEAQASRSRYQDLADRAAFVLTLVALTVSIPTFAAWTVLGAGVTFALARTVTVLVITCPHALGLAIPLVTVNATGLAAQNGILVRDRKAFDRGRDIRIVAFDKTGTLTEGRFGLDALTVAPGVDETEALAVAGALERASEHPLASAIVEAAEERGAPHREARDVKAVPGQGLEGEVDGRRFRVGRPEWAEELGAAWADGMRDALARADERGASAVVLMDGDRVVAVIALADRIRESAREAVRRLQEMGVEPVMITGDAEAVARTVAEELGIRRYHARVMPGDKAEVVERLRRDGMTAFVGDGINDAPALLTADLGIAIGAGTQVAIESADLVLVEDDPGDVPRALRLARLTHRKMMQNLAWATGYNVFAIPLAAGVGARWGLVLDPAVGAVLMSASTVVVSLNAMLLRRARLG